MSGNRSFEQGLPGVPGLKRAGHRFAAGVALGPSGQPGRLDLTIATPGEGRQGTLWLLRDVTVTLGAASTRRLALASVDGQGGAHAAIALGGAAGG